MCGLAFNNVSGTTTTQVKRIIAQAQADIKHVTGTTTGEMQDRAIKHLSCAFTVQNAMSNMDPNSGNQIMYAEMRDRFFRDADNALRLTGRSLDGIKVQFSQVNP